MPHNRPLDDVDWAILNLLRDNARRSVRDIAAQVNLSPAAVGRRIKQLETSGVIVGYTAVVRDDAGPATLDAFIELRFSGDTKVDSIIAAAASLPEVLDAYTTTGDPDAIVLVRADDPTHLRRVVSDLRGSGGVTSTRTMIVVDRWHA
jgi:DNA-binding Lrp family transcriptional regulator